MTDRDKDASGAGGFIAFNQDLYGSFNPFTRERPKQYNSSGLELSSGVGSNTYGSGSRSGDERPRKTQIKTLAQEFNVSYNILYRRLHGRASRKNRISTIRAFYQDQEEPLLSYITVLDDAGVRRPRRLFNMLQIQCYCRAIYRELRH
jgi:hypothetical protein